MGKLLMAESRLGADRLLIGITYPAEVPHDMASPFPRSMQHDEEFDWWQGTVKLPEFRDVKIKFPGRKSSSSLIELRVRADDDGPTVGQEAAYTYLKDNQGRVLGACLKGIAKTAKGMRPIFEKSEWVQPGQLDELLPKSPTADTLRTRVRLYDLCITDRVKGGIAYVEYSFNCAWDGEHGLLVVLHRDRLAYSGLTGDGW